MPAYDAPRLLPHRQPPSLSCRCDGSSVTLCTVALFPCKRPWRTLHSPASLHFLFIMLVRRIICCILLPCCVASLHAVPWAQWLGKCPSRRGCTHFALWLLLLSWLPELPPRPGFLFSHSSQPWGGGRPVGKGALGTLALGLGCLRAGGSWAGRQGVPWGAPRWALLRIVVTLSFPCPPGARRAAA